MSIEDNNVIRPDVSKDPAFKILPKFKSISIISKLSRLNLKQTISKEATVNFKLSVAAPKEAVVAAVASDTSKLESISSLTKKSKERHWRLSIYRKDVFARLLMKRIGFPTWLHWRSHCPAADLIGWSKPVIDCDRSTAKVFFESACPCPSGFLKDDFLR